MGYTLNQNHKDFKKKQKHEKMENTHRIHTKSLE